MKNLLFPLILAGFFFSANSFASDPGFREEFSQDLIPDTWSQVYTFLKEEEAGQLKKVSVRSHLGYQYLQNPWFRFRPRFTAVLNAVFSGDGSWENLEKALVFYRYFEASEASENANHLEFVSSHHLPLRKVLLRHWKRHLESWNDLISSRYGHLILDRKVFLAAAALAEFTVCSESLELLLGTLRDPAREIFLPTIWHNQGFVLREALSSLREKSDFSESSRHITALLRNDLENYLRAVNPRILQISDDDQERLHHRHNLAELWCLNQLLLTGKSHYILCCLHFIRVLEELKLYDSEIASTTLQILNNLTVKVWDDSLILEPSVP